MRGSTGTLFALVLALFQFQFVGASTVHADVSFVSSPEARLLESMIAIEGENLPQDQRQTQVQAAFSQYTATAAQDAHQAQRMSDALVEMNIYTHGQADQMMSAAQATSAKLAQPGQSFNETTVKAALLQFASTNPAGAEFSGCDVMAISGAALMLGTFGYAIEQVVVYNEDPSQRTAIKNSYAPYLLMAGFVTGIVLGGEGINCDE